MTSKHVILRIGCNYTAYAKSAAGGELEETPRILFDDMRIKKNQNKKSFLGNFFYFLIPY